MGFAILSPFPYSGGIHIWPEGLGDEHLVAEAELPAPDGEPPEVGVP